MIGWGLTLVVAGLVPGVPGQQAPATPRLAAGGVACANLEQLTVVSPGIRTFDDPIDSGIVRLGYRAVPCLLADLLNDGRLDHAPLGWTLSRPPTIREIALRLLEEIAGSQVVFDAIGNIEVEGASSEDVDWERVRRSLARWYELENAKDHSGVTLRASALARQWCGLVQGVRVLPFRREEGRTGDEVFDALREVGDDAVPCLIDRVLDMRSMKDPRMSPPQDVTVGDVALMILTDVASRGDSIGSVAYPADVLRREKAEGYTVRIQYASDVKNRRRMYARLKAWYERAHGY
jgi:hypothetical protein